MKYVPSLPLPITVPEDRLDVNALGRVKPAKPVQKRTLPPLINRRREQPETPPDQIQREERRHAEPLLEERRIYCRRINHYPILEELRSVIERRRRNLRGTDMTEHIDEEA